MRGKGGQCVQYAWKFGFEIRGNARNWPENARKLGYTVDKTPTVGSIIVTSESSAGTSTGHVTGAILKIEEGYSYQCEWNYRRFTETCGWIDLGSPVILAFIHPK